MTQATLFQMDAEIRPVIGSDESLAAYYQSDVFERYDKARRIWGHVQLAYSDAVMLRHPKIADGLVEAINITRGNMMTLLEECRKSPEHKNAFGW
jgi:hypothetical protein